MTDSPARTPLYDWHRAHGGRVVDFAGWALPVQYSSIVEEHQATRAAAGLFDISHMGRIKFSGPDSAAFLDRLLTRRVIGLAEGLVRYSLVTNDAGGILDDVLVYRLGESAGRDGYLLVVNASNRAKIVAWLTAQHRAADRVTWEDVTTFTAMLAVQGPRSIAVTEEATGERLGELGYYTARHGSNAEIQVVSRTGYTGEDGCELILESGAAQRLAERLIEVGAAVGLRPCGLGARDTLRLEAGMPLYGHELTEAIDPFQAGLGFAVHLTDREFVGSAALRRIKDAPAAACRVGLRLSGKRVPREQYRVWQGDQDVGWVTSGTFSPTLEQPIAMAYVRAMASEPGTLLDVDVRGRREPAVVAPLPFYRRS